MLNHTSTHISYSSTGRFSNLVNDYIEGHPGLSDFYAQEPSWEGIKKSISIKSKKNIDRKTLVERLKKQYQSLNKHERVINNIDALLAENTYTICTAHQPNILTGHLYFIYKIVHAIKLADSLNEKMHEFHFVPVYYMGSEDADLEELGTVYIKGVHHRWDTNQKGAIGRMKVDQALIDLISKVEIEFKDCPFGFNVSRILKESYQLGTTIEQATFHLVNCLFQQYGLIVLLPDHAELKTCFKAVVQDELLHRSSYRVLQQSLAHFPLQYELQVKGRELNLFYLNGDIRQRIEYKEDLFRVAHTDLKFTGEEIMEELDQHPERFSPNVILRPLFQESILPNVVFIGGGGEVAYWLELKNIFEHHQIPMPVVVLRNSFLFIESDTKSEMDRLEIKSADLFRNINELTALVIKGNHETHEDLQAEIDQLQSVFLKLKEKASTVDVTLEPHVSAIEQKLLHKIQQLSQKIWRAEKRKHHQLIQQMETLLQRLFPEGNLQERMDNFFPYYANYGDDFIQTVYLNSNDLYPAFTLIDLK